MNNFDAVTNGVQQTSGTSYSFAHTCTGVTRLLWVAINADTTATVSGVTYNGVAMTLLFTVTNTNDGTKHRLFYLINPASGANNVVVSYTLGTFITPMAVSYTGARQSGVPDASSSTANTGAATSRTETVTVVEANSWAVMIATCNAGPPAAGTGSTQRGASANRMSFFDSNGPLAAGARSMTATQSSTEWASSMASFAPDAVSLDTSAMLLVF
jgi:hypothetical protein